MAESFPALLASLVVILVAAKLGSHLAAMVGQPAVLGELLAGVFIGNLLLVGFSGFEYLKASPDVGMLADLGVVILLFLVGLDATVGQMLRVGLSSLLVGTIGVIGPFALGWGVGAWLLPEASLYTHMFLGATLTATSVGITARLLDDLGRSQTDEARIILGAAVIDDVQGLVLLAVVTGIVAAANQGSAMSYAGIGLVVVKAGVFLFGCLALGVYISPRLMSLASRLHASGVLLTVGLAWCFLFAWIADAIGLAPIVGAFAAGLIFEDVHYRPLVSRGEHTLKELVEPIASFLVPIFFVLMGIRTDLAVFGQPGVLGLAAALTAAAVIGKQMCGLGVLEKGLDRLSVGVGMIPRGEVGLIFANTGLVLMVAGERVVDQSVFSAVVVMVMATTVITPPVLKWSLSRSRSSLVS